MSFCNQESSSTANSRRIFVANIERYREMQWLTIVEEKFEWTKEMSSNKLRNQITNVKTLRFSITLPIRAISTSIKHQATRQFRRTQTIYFELVDWIANRRRVPAPFEQVKFSFFPRIVLYYPITIAEAIKFLEKRGKEADPFVQITLNKIREPSCWNLISN